MKEVSRSLQYHHKIPGEHIPRQRWGNSLIRSQKEQIKNSFAKFIRQEQENKGKDIVNKMSVSPTYAMIQDRGERRGGVKPYFSKMQRDNKLMEYTLYFKQKYKEEDKQRKYENRTNKASKNISNNLSPALSASIADEQDATVQDFFNYRDELLS